MFRRYFFDGADVPRSFQEIIAQWPSRKDLADDVGVDVAAVRMWNYLNRIPRKHWDAVIVSAAKWRIRGITLPAMREALMITLLDKREKARARSISAERSGPAGANQGTPAGTVDA